MRATTLWNPWAGLMARGLKTFETRGQRILYRGDICIHAGAHTVKYNDLSEALRDYLVRRDLYLMTSFTYSAIVAVVELYDCIPTLEAATEAKAFGELELGNYQPGRFAYLTRNLRALPNPVPCKGKQSISWPVPNDVAIQVNAQLRGLIPLNLVETDR